MTTAKDIYTETTKDAVTIFRIIYSQANCLTRVVVCKRCIIQTFLAGFTIHRKNFGNNEWNTPRNNNSY